MQRQRQQGFTLIELMIIVTIIAILAAIAIPAYNDFTTRSKVTEGMNLASAAQLAMAEYYMAQGAWPVNNAQAGLALPEEISGEYVAQVSVEDNIITVLFRSDAGAGIADQSIQLGALDDTGAIHWQCYSATIADKFLPPNCRGGLENLTSPREQLHEHARDDLINR